MGLKKFMKQVAKFSGNYQRNPDRSKKISKARRGLYPFKLKHIWSMLQTEDNPPESVIGKELYLRDGTGYVIKDDGWRRTTERAHIERRNQKDEKAS